MENLINISFDSVGNGYYNAYISVGGNSGDQYRGVSAEEIGKIIADTIDCLEESESGKSYLQPSILNSIKRMIYEEELKNSFEINFIETVLTRQDERIGLCNLPSDNILWNREILDKAYEFFKEIQNNSISRDETLEKVVDTVERWYALKNN